MNLFEYQGKDLYKKYSINTPRSIFIKSKSDLQDDHGLSFPLVVKAQVQVGGRGKAGGIKIANNHQELNDYIDAILGMDIKGHKVESLLIEEASEIISEYYISFTLDRSEKKYLMMLSSKGGMDIEEVAEETPEAIHKTWVNPSTGLLDSQKEDLGISLDLSGAALEDFVGMIGSLYELFVSNDCSMVEINPLVRTKSDEIVALDAKVGFDENASFRHKEWEDLRDYSEEEPTETRANEAGLSYVKLDGDIGCLVNGAGLAMATMDVIKLYGGEPANFLDIGGGADEAKVQEAFEIILEDPNVKGILVNIFGGIQRCDIVAKAVLAASEKMGLQVPLVIRLSGTMFEAVSYTHLRAH